MSSEEESKTADSQGEFSSLVEQLALTPSECERYKNIKDRLKAQGFRARFYRDQTRDALKQAHDHLEKELDLLSKP